MITIKNAALRNILKIIIPFLLVPAILAVGVLVFKEKSYTAISIVISVLSLVLFISGFEKKKTGTRRLVIVAVMTALSVVGRFIPIFKPITALTVITAVYIGGEAGFLVGAMSALVSNFSIFPRIYFAILLFRVVYINSLYIKVCSNSTSETYIPDFNSSISFMVSPTLYLS